MPNYTNNYNLIKPKKSDNYDIDEVTNTNMDILDTELAKKVNSIPGKGLSSNDFTEAYKRKIEQIDKAKKGTTFTPTVDIAGNITWVNDGDEENPEPRNIRGPEGIGIDRIENGPINGATRTYYIYLTNGRRYSIYVSNGKGITSIEKTSSEGKFDTYTITFDDFSQTNYQIKNGEDGETGPVGPVGPQGPQGKQGIQGEEGPANTLTIGTVENGESAQATITGESPNQVLNLVLPRGEDGAPGKKGEKGDTPSLVDYYNKTDVDKIVGDIEFALDYIINGGENFGRRLYSFGLLSDVHVSYNNYKGAVSDYKRALVALQKLGVDFITVAGDLTYNGNSADANVYHSVVDKYLKVPLYACTGNHDCTYTEQQWKDLTGLDWNFAYTREEDVFIFVHLDYASTRYSTANNPYSESIEWLRNKLTQYQNAKRIFLYMHFPPSNTAGLKPNEYYGYSSSSTQDNEVINMIKDIPNLYLITGHSHYLFEADSAYQYMNFYELDESTVVHVPSSGWCKAGSANVSSAGIFYASEGFIVDVYENGIVFKPIDFSTIDIGDPNITEPSNTTPDLTDESVIDNISIDEAKNAIMTNRIKKYKDKEKEIPEKEYEELESVYVNGAYINSNIIADETAELELTVKLTKNSQYLAGTYSSQSADRFDLQYTSSNKVQFGLGTSSVNQVIAGLGNDNQFHKFKISALEKKLYMDDTLLATSTNVFSANARELYILEMNTPTPDTTHRFIGNFKNSKIWLQGELIMDLIPIKIKADNSIKILNKITGTYYEFLDGSVTE